MRLIDADKLKEYLQEYLHYEHAIPWIDAQPTAFNVEKVVDRLEEMFKHHSATETVKRLVLETVKGSGTDDKELKPIEKE